MKYSLVLAAGLLMAANGYAQSSASSVVEPTAESAVTISSEAVGAKKKVWGVSYLAENTIGTATANRGNSKGLESQQHLGLSYALSDARQIQYRQYFYYNMTKSEETNEWAMGDHVFQFSDTSLKLGEIPLSTVYARMYFPGAETSREVGKYELRLLGEVTQELSSDFNIQYALAPRFYAYSGNDDGQRALRLLPSVTVEYVKGGAITPFATVYTDHSFRHTGKGLSLLGGSRQGTIVDTDVRSDSVRTDLGAKIALGKNAGLTLYLETDKDLRSHKNFDITEDDNNSYNLEFSASL